jgi:magnesium and cobalt transporter
MLKMKQETDEPPSTSQQASVSHDDATMPADALNQTGQNDNGRLLNERPSKKTSLGSFLKRFSKNKNDSSSLRDVLEEYIEAPEEPGVRDETSAHERKILSNILKLRDVTVSYVMIPRAEIVAIDVNTAPEDVLRVLSQRPHSRIPVYRESLDDVLGTIHVKDVLAVLAEGKTINLAEIITDIPIVSPAMPVLELILAMRQKRRHMALVIDEYGGIDGLVTVGDVIEAIIGEIDDEHDIDETAQIQRADDGSVVADARVDIDEFEEEFGRILSEEEREDNDTLGGLVCAIAGYVPSAGEVLTHDTGTIFEILDADQRRVHSIRISNIPE